MDSGISLNGDTISSPDSDNSSQHHMQNQSVSIEATFFEMSMKSFRMTFSTPEANFFVFFPTCIRTSKRESQDVAMS